jgi:hypothetical protein
MNKAVQDELYDDYDSMEFLKVDEWESITSEQLAPIIKQFHEAVIEAGGFIYSEPRFQVMTPGDWEAVQETDFIINPCAFVPDPIEFKTAYRTPQKQRPSAVINYQTETHAPTDQIGGLVRDHIASVLNIKTADQIVTDVIDGKTESLEPITTCPPLAGAIIDVNGNNISLPYLVLVLLASRPKQCRDYDFLSMSMTINADEL